MSIVSTIPTEILTKIFLILRDGPILLQKLSNASYFDKFPWAVGQVCRHWRAAFLSYPALWTCLSLKAELHYSEPSVAAVAEINRRTLIYLDRSEQQPLTITLLISCPSFSPIWSILLSCSDRWKKADLWVPSDIVANGLAKRRAKMPILESLKIAVLLDDHRKDPTAFEVTPHLTELDLMYPEPRGAVDWMLRGWSFPWAQLTKFRIDLRYLAWDAFQTFFHQFQNLEELRIITHYNVDADDVFNRPSVHLGRLRSLDISLVSPPVFSWLKAPLLERLVVHGGESFNAQGLQDFSEELLSFVHRSSCLIHHLTLQDSDVAIALEVVKALTSVRELCIKETYKKGPGMFRSLVREIAELYGDGCLPNLRVVQVPCCPQLLEQFNLEAHCFFEVRSRDSSLAPPGPNIAPLEKLAVSVDWDDCGCGYCCIHDMGSTAIARAFDVIRNWPSFSVVHLNYDRQHLILSLNALVGSTEVDLTIYYPRYQKEYMYPCDGYEHYRLLQNEG